MSIQGLLVKGAEGSTTNFEKVADGILALPRVLWQGHDVKLKKNHEVELKFSNSIVGTFKGVPPGEILEPAIIVMLSVLLILGSILAAPPLIVGLICKKIALIKSEKANKFHEVVEDLLQDANKIDKTKEYKDQINIKKKKIRENNRDINRWKSQLIEEPYNNIQKGMINIRISELGVENEKLLLLIEKYENDLNRIEIELKPTHEKVEDSLKKFLEEKQ